MFGTKLRRPPQCTTFERITSLQVLARHRRFQRKGGEPRRRYPKAYLAFASLLASYTLIKSSVQQDTFTKWLLLIAVMIVVDIVLRGLART